jgi:alkanesulfonate monooxygenase SsuD/methylene tetrahydromethanopterin reductase-like flavin-dependent oxidoreductase (luciferase family)
MALFGMRFDLRNPSIAGTTMTARCRAALDMAGWADRNGFVTIVLSEHHGSDDGYLPSALTMAAAMAARTERIRLSVSAIVAPLHDPVRLAEEVAVVDAISAGRLDVVLANGYVAAEFEMFGVPMAERATRVAEAVDVLRRARSGEPFVHRGVTKRVTPAIEREDGPTIALGGSTPAAARRAARIADGFTPSVPEVWQPYRDERIAGGHADPGPYFGVAVGNFHLADDVDAGWDEVGRFFLHETNAYGRWMADAGLDGMYREAKDVDEIRERGMYRVLTPDLLLAEIEAAGPWAFVLFHPMLGGIPPDSAWRSLHRFEHDVLGRLGRGPG